MRRLCLLLGFLALGCDDGAAKKHADSADDASLADVPHLVAPDAGSDAALDAAPAEADAAPPAPDAAPAPMAAWVEVTLDPRQPLYGLDDAVTATAHAFDRYGHEIVPSKFAWSVEPPGIADVDEDGGLHFLAEGQGFVRACTTGAICGRAAFYVDAGPPTLVVDEPERGAVLGGGNSATIHVRGQAGDGGGRVTVRVNGLPVDLEPDGHFDVDLTAQFGLNRVEVTADDGVRRPPVRDVREVLWAPAWVRADDHGVTVPAALELRLEQPLLDHDAPVQIPADAGPLVLDELASVVEALLRLADPAALLGDDLRFGDGDTLSLAAQSVRLGEPQIDLAFVADGIELFVRLPDVEVDTAGFIVVEGERISLDGTLQAGLAAYAHLRLALDGAALHADVADVSVAVEDVAGAFADPAANALISTFGGRLRGVAESLVGDSVDGLLREGLPPILEGGLDSLTGALSDVPLALDPHLDGFAPVTLHLGLAPSALDLRRHQSMALSLDARIEQSDAVQAEHPDPGVPDLPDAAPPAGDGAGLLGAIRLSLLNGVLHEVWRAGLLHLTPALPPELVRTLGEVHLDGLLPPVVAPAPPGADALLELQIGELRLEARQPMAAAGDVYNISIRAGLWLRVVDGHFQLVVADDPDIRADILSQAGARPVLPPNALASLLEAVIWPKLQDALAGGLALGFDPVQVAPDALQRVAPRLAGLTLTPRFVQDPVRDGGRVLLEGGLDVQLDLGP